MQLTGELKEKVEKAENKEEAKKILEEAGLELSDTELDQIAGGEPLFRLPLCQGCKGNIMQLTGELKEKVEKTENKEEAKKTIEDAGVELTDSEMGTVVGGGTNIRLTVPR